MSSFTPCAGEHSSRSWASPPRLSWLWALNSPEFLLFGWQLLQPPFLTPLPVPLSLYWGSPELGQGPLHSSLGNLTHSQHVQTCFMAPVWTGVSGFWSKCRSPDPQGHRPSLEPPAINLLWGVTCVQAEKVKFLAHTGLRHQRPSLQTLAQVQGWGQIPSRAGSSSGPRPSVPVNAVAFSERRQRPARVARSCASGWDPACCPASTLQLPRNSANL